MISKAAIPRTSHSLIYCPKRTVHLKAAVNNEQLQDNMTLKKQLSYVRRRQTKMCDECMLGHLSPCEKENCPCLCNDPTTEC